MVNLCAKTSSGECIQGDIGSDSTLFELWKHARYSKTMSAGFNCQPFSKLGDEKGGKDPRSACLPMVLRAAHMLQIQILVLECVQPAASDEFVRKELSKFQQCTGFHCRQVNLSLQDAWPTRRDRAWWILSSPLVGPIDIEEMPAFNDLDKVCKIIPKIFPWSEEDENALSLSDVELDGFGVSHDAHQRYLLNMQGKAPCALHSWGSQLHPCPCGCRSAGLASWRLEQKGLFGLLVRSTDGRIRHVHPNEAMMLNALDPIPDLGSEPRLSLCGVGQLASPLQALWIFSHIDRHLNMYRFGHCPFTPIMQLQAYRSWLIMRGRQIWYDDFEPIEDPQLLTLVEVWKQVKDLSLPELVYPFRWPTLSDREVTIATVLDHLMKQPKSPEQQVPPAPEVFDEPTPWFEQPLPQDFRVYPQGDVCMLHFPDSGEAPVKFALPEDAAPNFGDFLIAQAKLNGPVNRPMSARCDGIAVDSYLRLQAGQVIQVCPIDECDDDVSMEAHPRTGHHVEPNDGKQHHEPNACCEEAANESSPTCQQGEWGPLPRMPPDSAFDTAKVPETIVSPTAPWTQQPHELPADASGLPSRPSVFDIGECVVPMPEEVCNQSWISAAPLLGLHADQFLKLSLPCVLDTKHLWSLRHQFLSTADRLVVLEHQGLIWADDEIRFHLGKIRTETIEFQARNLKPPMRQPVVLDPLLTAGWLKTSGISVHQWASSHPEIRQRQLPILSVFLVDSHWVPVFMNPVGDVLHVFSWDEVTHDNDGFPSVLQTLGSALGFLQVSINQQKRLFLSSSLCGALAIGFLRHSAMNHMLPATPDDAENFHDKLRSQYVQALRNAQITVRPWVWGHGFGDVAEPKKPEAPLPELADRWTDSIPCEGEPAHSSESTPPNADTGDAVPREWGPLPKMPPTQLPGNQGPEPDETNQTQPSRWRRPSAFDIGECNLLPAHEVCPHGVFPIDQLVQFDMLQLVSCSIPVVRDTFHLWFLRHQFISTTDRLRLLHQQDLAFGDDEIRFHLGILGSDFLAMQIHSQGPPIRRVTIIDPLLTAGWTHEHGIPPQDWAGSHPEVLQKQGPVVTALFVRTHWIPMILIPDGTLLRTYTWDLSGDFDELLTNLVRNIGIVLGFHQIYVEHGKRQFGSMNMCGALAVAYLRHMLLHEALPTCSGDALEIHDRLRLQFATAIQQAQISDRPWLWGSGDVENEDSPRSEPGLPASTSQYVSPGTGEPDEQNDHPPNTVFGNDHWCISVEDRLELLRSHRQQWGNDEISFHISHLLQIRANQAAASTTNPGGFLLMDPLIAEDWEHGGSDRCREWCLNHPFVRTHGFSIVSAFLINEHWFPVWFSPRDYTLQIHIVDDVHAGEPHFLPMVEVIAEMLDFPNVVFHWIPPRLLTTEYCGAMALAFLGNVLVGSHIPDTIHQLRNMQSNMKATFVQALFEGYRCRCPRFWGSGSSAFITKQLAQELIKHGVPEDLSESRAADAIKAIGSEPIAKALQGKQAWRQLKTLANNVKFKFLLPSELAHAIKQNEGKPVGKKAKMPATKTTLPSDLELDPAKLQLLDGCFRAGQQPISQISLAQVGPVARGIAIVSPSDAEPFLRTGTILSQEPLALAIVGDKSAIPPTMLAHVDVTAPCRCTVNQEPILADVRLVQLGQVSVDKHTADAPLALEALDVLTLKVLVYRDELGGEWDDFVAGPIRKLVATFPALARCFATGCQCPAWHNVNQLPLREPILDVWRRQFLRNGFRPSTPPQAELFSVCIRIPAELMPILLTMSGTNGCYTEPRTAEGTEVLQQYVVVWAPKMPLQDLLHFKQTNPAVIGVARTGERRGLRVLADQAKQIHALLKPDVMFRPNGPRLEFLAGPFPYGMDRAAIARALKGIAWEVKPLQPAAPVPGRGAMWILHAVAEPPESVVQTSHGEVVISRRKFPDAVPKQPLAQAIGEANALTLCGNQATKTLPEVDPWSKHDPWRSYQSTGSKPVASTDNDSMQQLEQRIQNAVLAKIPTPQPMEQDDVPDRIAVLETQVQHLMTRHQGMETQFKEFSAQNTHQLTSMQTQINSQTQQIHGQLESQAQSIQALFESQMAQIRGLLAKRPRDDGME